MTDAKCSYHVLCFCLFGDYITSVRFIAYALVSAELQVRFVLQFNSALRGWWDVSENPYVMVLKTAKLIPVSCWSRGSAVSIVIRLRADDRPIEF
jgi:hypothetical protein